MDIRPTADWLHAHRSSPLGIVERRLRRCPFGSPATPPHDPLDAARPTRRPRLQGLGRHPQLLADRTVLAHPGWFPAHRGRHRTRPGTAPQLLEQRPPTGRPPELEPHLAPARRDQTCRGAGPHGPGIRHPLHPGGDARRHPHRMPRRAGTPAHPPTDPGRCRRNRASACHLLQRQRRGTARTGDEPRRAHGRTRPGGVD